MHFILTSLGSDGDIFPYIGLGRKLRDEGHQVSLVASADYLSLGLDHEFQFHALVSEEENRALFGHPEFWNPRKNALLMARWGTRFVYRQYELLKSLAGRDSTLVANPGVFAAAMVHEKIGTPWVSLVLQPWGLPSSVGPPVMQGFEFLRGAPPPIWKLFWLCFDAVLSVLVGRHLNRLRFQIGLKPLRRILREWLSPHLVIGLFPPWYGPMQVDWPKQLCLTGFPMFDGGKSPSLSDDLSNFCRKGDPPLVFTYGTGMAYPKNFFLRAIETCDQLGVRGIFLTKYSEQLPGQIPDSVFHAPFAPFQALFPHCAAVVHHGGIGTVAKAMATATPQLIFPIAFDQLDNGVRVKALGVGGCSKCLSPEKRSMAHALSKIMSPQTISRCREISSRFREQDALAETAQKIIEFARRQTHRGSNVASH